jgi:S1-C subfamily serine protease
VVVGLASILGAGAAGALRVGMGAVVERGVVDVTAHLGYQRLDTIGTGMVVTPSGEVLTNNHVIRGATSIQVSDAASGRTYSATVVGYDLGVDVAVLELKNASGLATARRKQIEGEGRRRGDGDRQRRWECPPEQGERQDRRATGQSRRRKR